MSEKLQKVLAHAGLGSRREMEAAIEAGLVSVNGAVATLGDRVEPIDKIKFKGKDVTLTEEKDFVCRVLVYNKPEGELCTRKDPEGRKTVFDRLPRIHNGRWIAIGRLDANTSGLLLFTNDGELANRMMHPSSEVEREYAVRVFGEVDDAMLNRLRKGVQLEDGPAQFKKLVSMGGEGINRWFRVVLTEGRNREVRRLWESQEVQVSRLKRVRMGNLSLDSNLPAGGWRELELNEVNYLREMVQLPKETQTILVEDSRRQHTKTSRIRRAVSKHRKQQNHRNVQKRR